MTYAIAAALQKAVFERLQADATLTGLIETAIYDAIPPGILGGTYVSLGTEDVRDASDDTGYGAWHEITISVVTDEAGFAGAKAVATAVSDALVDAPLTLDRGHLVALNFYRARARRVQDADVRRIDLRFRARVEDA
ncbi:MAG: DUF3168 domain-containing protein [Maritimibacter sp.]|nr:DUF3168 domain-containing protein [Maritimibacter sp.]